ncbi:MAG TPA: DUF4295 family protein [Balneolales bacterium]|nr:DUF4295 family protein [Balneolales bacterium]
MAKKQTFGDKALQAKLAQRKMAKVIMAKKNERGGVSYKETILDADDVKEFLKNNK